jgi:hypothetical protein
MSLLRQSVAALLAAIVASTPAQSPMPPQSPTPAQDSQSQSTSAQSASPFDAAEDCTTTPIADKPQRYFPSYLSDSFPQLKSAVPALRNLKFEDHPVTGPEDAEPILNQAAEALGAMVPRVPNLIAKEELSQADVTLPYIAGGVPQVTGGSPRRGSVPNLSASGGSSAVVDGEEINRVLENKLDQPQHRNTFSYRIRSIDDPTLGPLLEEYRVNASDKAVDRNDFSAGNPRSVGYGSTWLMFVPGNLKQARFRYLGHQKIDRHETLVVAFAQDPEVATLMATVRMGSTPGCRYFVQGVLWIDEAFFEIVRLQTDLLAPLPSQQLRQLRSELRFSEVKIPARNLTLWMPSEVRISWQGKDSAGMELHRYSNYRLFAATSRIIIDVDPEESASPSPPIHH